MNASPGVADTWRTKPIWLSTVNVGGAVGWPATWPSQMKIGRSLRGLPHRRYLTSCPMASIRTSFARRREGNPGIVSAGGINWFPNRDALDYFCTEILHPAFGASCRQPVYAGSAVQRRASGVSIGAQYDIQLTGYVDDVRPRVHDAACFVVPLPSRWRHAIEEFLTPGRWERRWSARRLAVKALPR